MIKNITISLWFILILFTFAPNITSAADRSIQKDLDGDGVKESTAFFNKEGEIISLKVDKNQDGKPEEEIDFQSDKPHFRKFDSNNDGHFDIFQDLDGDNILKEQRDSNNDGNIDTIVTYSGSKSLVKKDRDGNGSFEENIEFDNKQIRKRTVDQNVNGHPEIVEEYSNGKISLRLADQNEDSRFEREDRFSETSQLKQTRRDTTGDGAYDYLAEYDSNGGLKFIREGIRGDRQRSLTEFQPDEKVVKKIDRDLNGIIESKILYRKNLLVREETDLDQDGHMDQVRKYLDGRTIVSGPRKNREEIREESGGRTHLIDADGDGRWEKITLFETSGYPKEIKEDRDRNGEFDQVSVYKNGVLVSIAADTKGDGIFDLTDFYDNKMKRCRRIIDLNGNGRPEAEYLYKNDCLDRLREDLDLDGRFDIEYIHSEKGFIVKSLNDEDRDGRYELIWHYDDSGSGDICEYDKDGDNRYETRYYYKEGSLIRVEEDRNGDGKPDVIEKYDGDGKISYLEKDNDYNGNFEIKQEF